MPGPQDIFQQLMGGAGRVPVPGPIGAQPGQIGQAAGSLLSNIGGSQGTVPTSPSGVMTAITNLEEALVVIESVWGQAVASGIAEAVNNGQRSAADVIAQANRVAFGYDIPEGLNESHVKAARDALQTFRGEVQKPGEASLEAFAGAFPPSAPQEVEPYEPAPSSFGEEGPAGSEAAWLAIYQDAQAEVAKWNQRIAAIDPKSPTAEGDRAMMETALQAAKAELAAAAARLGEIRDAVSAGGVGVSGLSAYEAGLLEHYQAQLGFDVQKFGVEQGFKERGFEYQQEQDVLSRKYEQQQEKRKLQDLLAQVQLRGGEEIGRAQRAGLQARTQLAPYTLPPGATEVPGFPGVPTTTISTGGPQKAAEEMVREAVRGLFSSYPELQPAGGRLPQTSLGPEIFGGTR